MKRRITYKEITLGLGILVALLVAFTFWVSKQEPEAAQPKTLRIISIPTVARTFFSSASLLPDKIIK